MAGIDLIPASYSKVKRVRRRARQFLIAFVSVVALVGLGRLALNRLIAVESVAIARLQKEGQVSAQSQAAADKYRQQNLLVEKQLAQLDELRGRDRLRLFLQAIDAAYSDSIWLDEVRFFRRDSLTTGNLSSLPGGARSGIIVVPKENVPVAGTTANRRGIVQRVEIVGHATNHTRLAEFMRALSSQPGIADVRLLDTGLRSYTNTQVIDLTLSLLVDETARRPQ